MLEEDIIVRTWGCLWIARAVWTWPWPPWRCWCWGWWGPSWLPGAGSRSYSKSPGDILWDAFTLFCSLINRMNYFKYTSRFIFWKFLLGLISFESLADSLQLVLTLIILWFEDLLACSLNSYRIIFFWNLTTVLLKIVLQLMQSFLLSIAALSSI